jgi:hypothetical protein
VPPRLDYIETQSLHQCSRRQAKEWCQLLGNLHPVVDWSTVHLTLTLSLLKDYKCQQVNFVQAYT